MYNDFQHWNFKFNFIQDSVKFFRFGSHRFHCSRIVFVVFCLLYNNSLRHNARLCLSCILTCSTLCNQCLSPLKLWFESLSWRGVLDTTLCDKFCQWLVTGRWFSPGGPVSTTNKTDWHNITEILLKVALNTITLTPHIRLKVIYA
jgi:hypothetical protein